MNDRARWIAPAIGIGAAAALLPLRNRGIMLLDDGWYLQPVVRMTQGEVLYREVWTFYAPGIHHLFAWLFELMGGPSVIAARTVLAAMVVASAVLAYFLARRFATPALACLPAVVYALAPGPWHKAYYGLLAIGFFVLLARALEAPRSLRFAALGAWAGVAFVTRQDLGVMELGIAAVAAVFPARWPTAFGRSAAPSVMPAVRWAAAAAAAFAVPAAVTGAYYASKGALPDLIDATFGAAVRQAGAHPPMLGRLLSPAHFGEAAEGRIVGVVMLLPLVLYPAIALQLLARLRRGGIQRETVLRAALLGFAVATLSQAYRPMLLLRFLQSALPFYVLAALAAADASRWLRGRGPRGASFAPTALAWSAAAFLIGEIWTGLPKVKQPIYTGSLRMLRYDEPVELWGESLREEWAVAEEIRLVRAFFERRTPRDEPVLAVPGFPTYNLLLERANPTRWIGEHATGNFVLRADQKRAESERLLASATRFAVVEQSWWARGPNADPMLNVLRAEFHPVRGYASALILERGNDVEWAAFAQRLRRAVTTGLRPADVEPFRTFAAAHPDEPLAWRMLGLAQDTAGAAPRALDAYQRAAALDPADVGPLERSAEIRLRLGDRIGAAEELGKARAVRESPATRALAAQLSPSEG